MKVGMGDGGKVRAMAGKCGRWRESAGDGGKSGGNGGKSVDNVRESSDNGRKVVRLGFDSKHDEEAPDIVSKMAKLVCHLKNILEAPVVHLH